VKNTLRILAPLLILVTTLVISSCASLVSDNTYDVSIVSEPAEASFTITDREGKLVAEGITPAIVPLDSFGGYFRRAQYDVTYSHADYPDKAVLLRATLSPFYFFNYPFGAAIGFFIDPFTGAMFNLPKETRGDLTVNTTDPKYPWN
jgi:hypothetical protein